MEGSQEFTQHYIHTEQCLLAGINAESADERLVQTHKATGNLFEIVKLQQVTIERLCALVG